MGDDDVERELAEAFKEQRDATNEGFARLESLMASDRKIVIDHMLEDARALAILEERTRAAHRRMDEHLVDHKDEKGGRFQLWIGVALAFVSAAFAALFAMFGGKKA